MLRALLLLLGLLLPDLSSSVRIHATVRPMLQCSRHAHPIASKLIQLDEADTASADAVVDAAIHELRPTFAAIDRHTEEGLSRVLSAFRRHGVGAHHFNGVDGYGHGDLGREALDSIYAELLGAEAALVRVQCFSGTHAIACALYGVLRPGQELLGVSGAPYDTLEEVIGLRGRTGDGLRGTLADFGVRYRQVELAPGGTFDLDAIDAAVSEATRMLHVQRSCGCAPSPPRDAGCTPFPGPLHRTRGLAAGHRYAWRPSIPVAEIGRLAAWLHVERSGPRTQTERRACD